MTPRPRTGLFFPTDTRAGRAEGSAGANPLCATGSVRSLPRQHISRFFCALSRQLLPFKWTWIKIHLSFAMSVLVNTFYRRRVRASWWTGRKTRKSRTECGFWPPEVKGSTGLLQWLGNLLSTFPSNHTAVWERGVDEFSPSMTSRHLTRCCAKDCWCPCDSSLLLLWILN